MAPVSRLAAAALLVAALSGCDWNPWRPEPDRAAPQVTLTAPAVGATVRDDSVRVTGIARDSVGAVTRVTYALGSGAEREVSITPGPEVSFAFTVTGLAAGSNTITVHAEDGRGNRGSQAVTVTYQPNRAPVAADDTASAWADSAVVIRVLANDTDPDGDSLRVSLLTQPTLGTATVGANGTIRYVPDPAKSGRDSFRYVATDPRGAADTVAVAVTVRPLPGPYRVWEIELPPITANGLVAGSVATRILRLNNQGHVLVRRTYSERTGNLPGDVRIVTEHYLWQIQQATPVQGTPVYDINNLGHRLVRVCTQTVGNQQSCVSYAYAIITSPLSREVLPYPGSPPSLGFLNDAGEAVLGSTFCQGRLCNPVPTANGAAWTPQGLNELGEIAGYATVSGSDVPVLYRGGAANVLQVPGSARATGLNDSTWVVGTTTAGGGSIFVWKGGTVTLIPGAGTATLAKVNLRGQVVFGASLWEAGRTFSLNTRLTDPNWEVLSAVSINVSGQIAAEARNTSTGASTIILLTPPS